MRFDYYAGEPVLYAVHLINTLDVVAGRDALLGVEDVRRFVAQHGLDAEARASDLPILHQLRGQLREVFDSDDVKRAIQLMNRLLEEYNSAPRLVIDEDIGLHVHFEPIGLELGEWLGAVTAAGLMFHLCDYGIDRIGLCASDSCRQAFIDTTKNNSKRFCSMRCSHRASVASYRERQKNDRSG